MADEKAATSTASTNTEVVTPAPAADQNAEVVQVNAKEWNELKATVNRLSAQTRVTGKKPDAEVTTSTKTNVEPLIPAKEIQDPRLDKWIDKHTKSLRANALSQAISSVGVAGDDADLLQSVIEGKYGDRIKVNTDTDQVLFEDQDGSEKSVKDLVQFVFAKHKDRFTPAKRAPNGGAVGGGSAGGSGGAHPFSNLTFEQIQKHPDSRARSAYAKEHPEELVRKQAEFAQSKHK